MSASVALAGPIGPPRALLRRTSSPRTAAAPVALAAAMVADLAAADAWFDEAGECGTADSAAPIRASCAVGGAGAASAPAGDVTLTAFSEVSRLVRAGRLAALAGRPIDPAAYRGTDGWTIIHTAVLMRDVDMTDLLLSNARLTAGDRAELIDAVTVDGDTALHMAVEARQGPAMFHVLMKHGADPTLLNRFGDTVIEVVRREVTRHKSAILAALCGLPPGEVLPTCTVCMEADADEAVKGCGHRFCRGCATGYLLAHVSSGGTYAAARCMHDGCDEVMDYAAVNALLSKHPAVITRLETLSRNECLTAMATAGGATGGGFSWCASCSSGGYFEGMGKAAGCTTLYCVAPDCGAAWCCICRQQHDASVTCETFAAGAESRSAAWLEAFSKACPRCGVRGVLERGCTHIKCRCKYEFCYHCGGPYMTGCYSYKFDTCSCAEFRAERGMPAWRGYADERYKGFWAHDMAVASASTAATAGAAAGAAAHMVGGAGTGASAVAAYLRR